MKIFTLAFLFTGFTVLCQEIEHKHDVHFGYLENKGQWDKDILLKSHFAGGNLWIQKHKMVFHIQDYSELNEAHVNMGAEKKEISYKQDVIHVNFLGSQEITQLIPEKKSSNYYNFFIGKDKSKWASDVHSYSEVKMQALYPGIDLLFIEDQEQLKYEFHLNPHASPELIRLQYAGQQKLSISKNGELIVESSLGKIIEEKPYAYQVINGKIKTVSCEFHLEKEVLSFKIGTYNPDFKLVIDPVLVFATYSGSVTDNFGMTATYGHDGSAYSGGTIFGNTYPTPDAGAYDVTSSFTVVNVQNAITTDVFISKYASDGSVMLWTTFLGGGDDVQGTETIHSMICDKQDNLYVYGATSSTDFPAQNGYLQSHSGGSTFNVEFNGAKFGSTGTDIYLAKISANGHNLLGATYFGGSGNDGVNYNDFGNITGYNSSSRYDSLTTNYGDQFRGEIMLDSLNNCLVASSSRSTDFPTLNPFQSSNGGQQDGVVFKLNSDLTSLIFSSYVGGSNNDACYSIKIDSSFNMVFSGGTSSVDLPATAGAWQSSYNGGISDGFVGKLNPSGTVLQRISYVGTTNYDQAFFVEIDRNDQVFLVGQSRGGTFPVFNSAFSNPNSGQFIAKLNQDLTVLQNSTVFGNGTGAVNISPAAFMVDICGNMYVSGWGASILQASSLSGMAVSPDALISTPPNGFDFYLMVVERSFQSLKYATYLGGDVSKEHVDGGTSRFDKNGVVYQSVCAGCWGNSDFPTTPGAWSNQNLSNFCNNAVFKFDFELVLNAKFTASDTTGCIPFAINFQNNSSASDTYLWDFGNGDTSTVVFNPTVTFNSPGDFVVTLITLDSICLLSDTAKTLVHIGLPLNYTVSNDTILCSPGQLDLMVNSFGSSNSFQWSSSISFADTLNSSLSDSVLTVLPDEQHTVYYLRILNSGCSRIDSVVVDLTSSGLDLQADSLVCRNDNLIVTAVNQSALNYTYSWFPSSMVLSQLSPSSVSANTAQPGYLYVNVNASNGCTFKDSIFVNVSQVSSTFVNASASDTVILAGTTVTLFANPNGNYIYQWTPSSGLSNPGGQQTTAMVNQTTTFTVEMTDGTCTATDSITILCVTNECKPPYVYVPNAFSPNASGKNEVFYVRGPQITRMLLRIYDRWGELVFESNDPAVGWDGTFKGRKLDPDVYDYYLKVVCIGGNEEIMKGNITLLK